MDQEFEIPVTYKNKELMIPARFRVQGYTYRIEAVIEVTTVYFERDDAGDFRALLPNETPADAKLPDAGLVQAIAETLTTLLA